MSSIAVIPGTYDPITLGHVDVIARAQKLFDTVIVAVASSREKRPLFSLKKRIELVKASVSPDVQVFGLAGLLVDFCAEKRAQVVVKGLRATTDFEYELAQADINAKLNPNLESVFIMAHPELGYISSSSVREMARLGADVAQFVTPAVKTALAEVDF